MKRVYLIVVLLLPFGHLVAQMNRVKDVVNNHKSPTILNQFDHLSVNNGLSSNLVNCILQDREGFMWFGTSNGLNKYDGYRFTVLQPNTAHNNQIYGIHEDHTGRLWAVTEGGGLHEVDKRTGKITPHLIRSRQANLWNYQHSIYEDSRHDLWISTLGGLARYQPGLSRFTLYPLPRHEASIKTVFEDPQHRLWVGTFRGLFLFDRSTGRYTPVPVPGLTGPQPAILSFYLDNHQTLWMATATAGHSLYRLDLRQQPWKPVPYNPGGLLNPFMYLNTLHRDEQGLIWVGTTNGLQCVDPANHQVSTCHPDPLNPKGISSNNVQAVYHDRAGTLWVGTDNGIDRQAATAKPFATYQVKPNLGTVNLPENRTFGLLMDHNRQLWLSTVYAAYRVQDGTGRAVPLPSALLGELDKRRNAVFTFLADSTRGVWLATNTGLYWYDQASGRYTAYRSDIAAEYIDRAPTGELWIGGDGGIASFDPRTHRYQYYRYRPNDPNGLPDQYVYGLLVGHTGEVWVLFRKQGLGRLNPRTRQFIRYTASAKSRLSTNDILTMYEDSKGVLWLGTQGRGLSRFDPKTGALSVITTQNGLLSNIVVGITGDSRGHLWLSTDKGLCRYDPQQQSIRNYPAVNGLPGNGFLRNAVSRGGEHLFFGSLNGVVYFNPADIRDDTRPFPVYITDITVMNKPRPLSDSVITLNYDENFISFGFAALSYARPEQNQYTYQLVGIDQKWVRSGSQHFANYTDLAPGQYTFRVKAANSDGFWSARPASVVLVIRPPWWQTGWAYLCYGLLAAAAIRGLILFYINRVRQQQTLAFNRREAEQLKAMDELKTRFFSNITHEFRTPLSLILSPVEKLLQSPQVDPPTRQTLGLIQRNASQLLRLINQLLDLSKLEANRMVVAPMRGDVAALGAQLIESVRQRAEQRGVTLTYTAEGLVSEYLFDADKWETILTNLLSNALKFTGQGGTVAVVFEPAHLDSNQSAIQIRVADTGIGISAENLPHIFDRFYQVDSSRTRAYEGTGIGLSLVKELVTLLGGSISVESWPGEGTTFSLVLPAQPASEGQEAPVSIRLSYASATAEPALPTADPSLADGFTDNGHQPLILVVEDNDELREFLAAELATTYRVLRAADGETGWQLAQTDLPDIVISDVMMPRMDGFELTRLLKSHPTTSHISVILLTAKAAHQSRMEGLQKGADEYLSKPFHLDELHLRVRNLLHQQQTQRNYYRQQLGHPDLPPPITSVDDAFLHQIYTLLDANLKNPALDVDWLADQLAMSRKTLYRKTHSVVQLSPTELIRQYRLRKAADLLRAGHSASQTAYQVGFKTATYFATVFKEFYGKTPVEFGGKAG